MRLAPEPPHAMSAHCCPVDREPAVDPAYRRALWVALVVNALMFVVELAASWSSGSLSLLADSIDFFGDAANYALSLVVVGMALSVRAKAALFKAACSSRSVKLSSISAGLPPAQAAKSRAMAKPTQPSAVERCFGMEILFLCIGIGIIWRHCSLSMVSGA